MTVTQTYWPPLAPGDIDNLDLNWAPALGVGERILEATAVASPGLGTVSSPNIGTVGEDGKFVASPTGQWTQVVVNTANSLGQHTVMVSIKTDSNRELTRTDFVPVAPRS